MHTKKEGRNLDTLCGLFGKRRQTYYKKKKSSTKSAFESEILIQMIAKQRRLMPRLGGKKLYFKLRDKLPVDLHMGRDKFFDLLRDNNLLVRRKRYKAITTMSSHWLRKYPNLIKEFIPDGPHQLWVSDITYIETSEGFVYLFLITDAYSRKIIGWNISDNLGADNAVVALYMALSQLPARVKSLTHHSDRGVQYCSSKYVAILNKNNVSISMTENGNPLENAVAERVNGILKTEWINEIKLKSLSDTIVQIGQIIDIYNSERPHCSIELLTPNQAHIQNRSLKRIWKNYYKTEDQECQI